MIKRCAAGSGSWISVAQMRDVDRAAIELGLTLTRMMENAGANLAWLASAMLDGDVPGRDVIVLAGPGGNGGGGLVAARRLIGWGANVDIRLASDPAEHEPIPLEQLRLLQRMESSIAVGAAALAAPDLFIDAILGKDAYARAAQGNPAAAACTAVGRRAVPRRHLGPRGRLPPPRHSLPLPVLRRSDRAARMSDAGPAAATGRSRREVWVGPILRAGALFRRRRPLSVAQTASFPATPGS